MTYVFTALRSTQITEVKITLGNPPECLFCIQASSTQNGAPFFFCTSQLLQVKSVSIKVRFSHTSLMIKFTSANFNIQLLTIKTIIALMTIKIFSPLCKPTTVNTHSGDKVLRERWLMLSDGEVVTLYPTSRAPCRCLPPHGTTLTPRIPCIPPVAGHKLHCGPFKMTDIFFATIKHHQAIDPLTLYKRPVGAAFKCILKSSWEWPP